MRTRLSTVTAWCGLVLASCAGRVGAQDTGSAPPAAAEVSGAQIEVTLTTEWRDPLAELGHGRQILQVVPMPEDFHVYGQTYDFGSWSGTSYAGLTDLPVGYWVYVYPNWYILGEVVAQSFEQPLQPGSNAWPDWHAMQATGAPNTFYHGDYMSAWASLSPDDQAEWLDLTYGEAVAATAILVFESYNPGAIQCVRIWDAAGNEQVVWQNSQFAPSVPQAYPAEFYHYPVEATEAIDVRSAPYGAATSVTARLIPVPAGASVSRVRIELNSPAVSGWNEIDAVGLLAVDGQIRWATGAEASSSFADWEQASAAPVSDPSTAVVYGSDSWAASQATGAPNTLHPGDYSTAWASRTQDDQAEWLELDYSGAPASPVAVLVHETYNPGALRKVTGWTAYGNEEVTLWEGVDPTSPQSASGVSIIPLPAGVGQLVRVRLHLDSPAVPGWNEIDAVGLLDAAGQTHWATGATASSSYAERYSEGGAIYYLESEALRSGESSGAAPATIIIRPEEELPR